MLTAPSMIKVLLPAKRHQLNQRFGDFCNLSVTEYGCFPSRNKFL